MGRVRAESIIFYPFVKVPAQGRSRSSFEVFFNSSMWVFFVIGGRGEIKERLRGSGGQDYHPIFYGIKNRGGPLSFLLPYFSRGDKVSFLFPGQQFTENRAFGYYILQGIRKRAFCSHNGSPLLWGSGGSRRGE